MLVYHEEMLHRLAVSPYPVSRAFFIAVALIVLLDKKISAK
jgi:hypothetical protein